MFRTLIKDQDTKYFMASKQLNALLAHAASGAPRAVALVYALKDAIK